MLKSFGRYLWASPNTLLGLFFVPLALFAKGGASVVDGVLEVHGPLIAWVLRHCLPLGEEVAAMTLGHVVLGRDLRSLQSTRPHERVHVRQYEVWGPVFLPVYLLASLWGALTRRGAYYGNVFERQAMRITGSQLVPERGRNCHPVDNR